MSEKWAEKLSCQCDLEPDFLKHALEELSESCLGDALSSQKVIEELTLKCSMTRYELSKFIAEVSTNCPVDAKKLHKEILKAEGKKEAVFNAIQNARARPI